jgi:hypothetical protein
MVAALNTGTVESTETTPAPAGHDAAMIAKADAGTTVAPAPAAPVSPERPAWLPEKFATAEDFAKSYSELEKKLGSTPAAEKPAETKPAGTEIPTPEAQAQVEKAGLNFDEVNAEYAKDGKLSDATYEKLSKGGINKATVDGYIAGQQALATQMRGEVFSVAGSEEQYTDMVAWAKDNMSADEIAAYNSTMNSKSLPSMKLAVEGLKARFVSANGSSPQLVSGRSGSGSQATGDAFRSTAELTTAMKDPRYASDPAYRKDVSDRLARSNIM